MQGAGSSNEIEVATRGLRITEIAGLRKREVRNHVKSKIALVSDEGSRRKQSPARGGSLDERFGLNNPSTSLLAHVCPLP